MKDETFIFLGEPYKGKAYRKMDQSNVKQYCKIEEIIEFINDSINNNTLKKGNKYSFDSYLKYKYNFINGNNKKSVSVMIDKKYLPLYSEEINKLNNLLINPGKIEKFNVNKIVSLLSTSMALMTYVNSVNYVR